VAEVDSFLAAHQRYGKTRLDQADRDRYIADTARIAAALGVMNPPLTELQLRTQLADYRRELAGTAEARAAARFVLLHPPLPALARAPYAALAAAAVGLMPVWTRLPLRLPYLPVAEVTVVRMAGQGVVSTIRWATAPN
jgi:uncharacterized protein (DUF2236 family)